jgi:inosose dehydratase
MPEKPWRNNMNVKIGNCPCSWGVWGADGSPANITCDTFLKEVSETGYKYIELGPYGFLPTDTGKLKEKLAKYKLEVCACTIHFPFLEYRSFDECIPKIRPQLELLTSLGGKFAVGLDVSDVGVCSSNKKNWTTEDYKKSIDKIGALNKFAGDEYGVMVVFHPHGKTPIETQKEIDMLIEATGINLCLDTGHHAYVNGELSNGDQSVFDCIRKYPEKIRYMHFKNVNLEILKKARKENMDLIDAFAIDVMCPLEDGMVDYRILKTELEKIGFNGFGVCEQDMIKKPQGYAYDQALKNYTYLKNLGFGE